MTVRLTRRRFLSTAMTLAACRGREPEPAKEPAPRAAEATGVTSTSIPPPLTDPEVDPRRLHVGKETLAILERGSYEAPSGKRVELRDAIERAVRGTRHHRPGDLGARKLVAGSSRPTIEISEEKTGDAARRLVEGSGIRSVGVPNFASAKAPAGGFSSDRPARRRISFAARPSTRASRRKPPSMPTPTADVSREPPLRG